MLNSNGNHLRVVSTPEYPVPYYQRITRAPAAIDVARIDLSANHKKVDDLHVYKAKEELSLTPRGLKVVDYIENKHSHQSLKTRVNGPGEQCNIYADDLVNYLDAAHEEDCRILHQCNLSDCLL